MPQQTPCHKHPLPPLLLLQHSLAAANHHMLPLQHCSCSSVPPTQPPPAPLVPCSGLTNPSTHLAEYQKLLESFCCSLQGPDEILHLSSAAAFGNHHEQQMGIPCWEIKTSIRALANAQRILSQLYQKWYFWFRLSDAGTKTQSEEYRHQDTGSLENCLYSISSWKNENTERV